MVNSIQGFTQFMILQSFSAHIYESFCAYNFLEFCFKFQYLWVGIDMFPISIGAHSLKLACAAMVSSRSGDGAGTGASRVERVSSPRLAVGW